MSKNTHQILFRIAYVSESEHLKKELVVALRKHLGIVSSACEAIGVSRTTYYKYYNEDSEFRSEVWRLL